MTNMKVELIDHMGDDLRVVNAARVSFDKESRWKVDATQGNIASHCLSQADTKLINYLAKHNHWSPFAHPQITLRLKAPIFVARQLDKHQVGFVKNEVSRRYIDTPPEFFIPDAFRVSAANVKQGSGGEHVDSEQMKVDFESYYQDMAKLYDALIEAGVCNEQARMLLPQAAMTTWFWTGSLLGWSRVFNQRTDSHSQRETQDVAKMIGDLIEPLFPVSWLALST
jgi:thymidylate synthase (FAD)